MRVLCVVQNRMGFLHGGMSATLVDVCTTLAMMTQENARPGVTTDLNVSYLSAVPAVGRDGVCHCD